MQALLIRLKDRYEHLSRREQGLFAVFVLLLLGGLLFLLFSSVFGRLNQFSEENQILRNALTKIQENRSVYASYQKQNQNLESKLTKDPLQFVPYINKILSAHSLTLPLGAEETDASFGKNVKRRFMVLDFQSTPLPLKKLLEVAEALQSDPEHIVKITDFFIQAKDSKEEFLAKFEVSTYDKIKAPEEKATNENTNKPENKP